MPNSVFSSLDCPRSSSSSDLFYSDQRWAQGRRPAAVEAVQLRLAELAPGIALIDNTAKDNLLQGFVLTDFATGNFESNAVQSRPGLGFCDNSGAGATDNGGNNFAVAGAPTCEY